MLNKLISILADNPTLFNFLRRILENNFKNQKKIISRFSSGGAGKNILDIGCGTGEFSVFFSSRDYTGIDIEKKYIDYANNNYKGKFIVADAGRLPFPDRSFDSIFIGSFLHHLSDEECLRVFKEARRALKPDGKMLVIGANAGAGCFLTRLMYRFDRGKFIRTGEEYRRLLTAQFAVKDDFVFKDGLYFRRAFTLN